MLRPGFRLQQSVFDAKAAKAAKAAEAAGAAEAVAGGHFEWLAKTAGSDA